MKKNEMIKMIADIEWVMFDKVNNIGGRASCQDEKQTFYIMRSSQLGAWSEALLESYLEDLEQAKQAGRNPLSEKYGYMMERTSPAEFAGIREQLPSRTPEKDALIDKICAQQTDWQEQLAERYPKLTGRGRSIRRTEDTPFNTSFETYMWGELATYSKKTIEIYADYVEEIRQAGKSIPEMVLLNTVKQYGFDSLDAAEERMG